MKNRQSISAHGNTDICSPKRNFLNYLKIFILSFFVLCVFMIHFELLGISFKSDLLIENSFILYAAIVVLVYFLDKHKTNNKTARKLSAFLGIFFSLSIVIDLCCSYNNTAERLFIPLSVIPLTLLDIIGYSVFFYYILCAAFKFIIDFESTKAAALSRKISIFLEKFLCKKPLLKIWFFIMLLYLPYLILIYPGVMLSDNFIMLNDFLSGNIDNHNPIMQTLIFGNFILIGGKLGSANLGLFAYTFIQYIYGTLILALLFKYIYDKKFPALVWLFSLLFVCLVPIFPITLVTSIKDSNYTLFLLLLTYCILVMTSPKDNSCADLSKKNMLLWFLSLILVCFSRKNGFHIAFIVFAALLLYFFKARKNISIKKIFSFFVVSICAFSVFMASELCTKYVFNIPDNNTRETASLMFQQTARYVWLHPEDVTKEEAEIIDKVIDYDNLASLYTPWLSDPVKNTFKNETGNEYFKDYAVVWFKHFTRHPFIYIDAFLCNSSGYFSPGNNIGHIKFREHDIYEFPKYNIYIKPPFDRFFSPAIFAYRCIELQFVPVIGMFFRLGSYIWALLFVSFYLMLFKKDKRYLIYLLPALLTLLICCVSPVNNHLRYGYPIIFSVPFLLCFCFNNSNTEKN